MSTSLAIGKYSLLGQQSQPLQSVPAATYAIPGSTLVENYPAGLPVRDPETGKLIGQTDGAGGIVPFDYSLATATAGTVNGSSQHVFTFTADSNQRLVGLILNINAASDVQASEQIASGIYSVYPLDYSGELILRSPGPAIERVAITALASSTYAAGDTISISETTAATILTCMSFLIAPTSSAIALTIVSTPTFSSDKITAASVSIKFAEAA